MKKHTKIRVIRFLIGIIVCICIFFLCRVNSVADTHKETVRVVFTEQDGLMEVNADGSYSGYTYEYIMKIAQFAGFDVEFIFSNESDVNAALTEQLQKVFKQEADVIGSLRYDQSISEYVVYTENNYGYVYTTIKKLNANRELTEYNLKDQDGLKIAVLSSSTVHRTELEDYCSQNGITYTIVECADEDEQIHCLENGMADAMLSVNLARFDDTTDIAMFSPQPFYFVCAKEDAQLALKIDQAILDIDYTEPDFRSTLENKYFTKAKSTSDFTPLESEYIENKDKLRVLVPYNLAPYCYYNEEEGEYRGIFIAFCDYLAQNTGLEIEYYQRPDDTTVLDAMKLYNCDMTIAMRESYSYTLNRDILFSESIFEVGDSFFYNSNAKLNDLSDCTIAIAITQPLPGEYTSQAIFYQRVSDCIEAVNDNKAQYGYGSTLVVEYEIRKNGYQNIQTISTYNTSSNYCVAFPYNTNRELVSIINKVIRSMDNATVDSFLIESGYASNDSSIHSFIKKQPLFSAFIVALIIVLNAFVLLCFIDSRRRKKQNEKLQKASAAKSEFLSRMSHDIRTPMNGIMGLTQMSKDSNDVEEIHEYLNKLMDSSTYLLGLLNDILTISKIEESKLKLCPVPVKTDEFMVGLLEVIRTQAVEKGVEFYTDTEKGNDVPYQFFDPLRVQQIVMNILNNAVKFTPAGGIVTYSYSHMELNGVLYCHHIITDTGIGMSEEFMKIMFDPFTQGNDKLGTLNTGTGLGLSICKKLIDMMDGRILVESKLNYGSTFTVDIPTHSYTKEKYELYVEEHNKNTVMSPVNSTLGKRLLVCDDNDINSNFPHHL